MLHGTTCYLTYKSESSGRPRHKQGMTRYCTVVLSVLLLRSIECRPRVVLIVCSALQ